MTINLFCSPVQFDVKFGNVDASLQLHVTAAEVALTITRVKSSPTLCNVTF